MPRLHWISLYALPFYFIILKGKFFFQQGQWRFFTVNTVDDGFFMNFFDNLITDERDLSFGLHSSLDIHTPALNFCLLAGGTMTFSGWCLARYRPWRHLATDYALCWRGWLFEKSKVPRRRHQTPDRPRRGDTTLFRSSLRVLI